MNPRPTEVKNRKGPEELQTEQNRIEMHSDYIDREARLRELETMVAEMTSAAVTTPTLRELELLERIKQLEDENTTLRANQHTYPSYGYHPYAYPYYQDQHRDYYPQTGPARAAPVNPSIPFTNYYYYNCDITHPLSNLNANTLETTLLGLQSLKSHFELVTDFCGTLTHFFDQLSTGQNDGSTPVDNGVKVLWIRVLTKRFRILSKCGDRLDHQMAVRAISDDIFGKHRDCMVMVADNFVSEGSANYAQAQLNSETAINDSEMHLEDEYKQLSSLQNDMGLVRTFFHATKNFLKTHEGLNADRLHQRIFSLTSLQAKMLLLCSPYDRIALEMMIDRYRKCWNEDISKLSHALIGLNAAALA
ncbi:hypothetical protein BCR33DRAFT_786809 [Rhizoclosmatium globosum]|uniref:Uncharacterized protein n=1 Tax=Rhizoclosmatium globosum TaxID=329046 RepID=A0A1Y2C3N8_9FUNG|nr:hypothetical protein BCR33DRAFT_786809 [Rhizoclosmatium globosum]|eukprot:ORY41566.1 hypothetical protein BCR33DRAFT_786809 [Rhizoclosmatium globosum]